jgi:hypothetical protein
LNSPVRSVALKIIYFLVGGLPALYLSLLCVVFSPAEIRAVADPNEPNRAEAMVSVVVFALAVVGTGSGALAFFGVGTNTPRGRVAHSLCIGGGMVAAALFAWETLQVVGVSLTTALFPIVPAIVGVCLLFHMWRAA